jgi:hypothetical protein
MRIVRWMSAALLAGTLAAVAGDTGTDLTHKYAWGENVGWLNAYSDHHTVNIHYSEGTGGWLSGHLWAENIGWIVIGSAGGGPFANTTAENWGVNLAGGGWLSGYAWGENVGWINFGAAQCDARIDVDSGAFAGHAWGENIGWVKFSGASPDYGVRTLAFDKQPKGTPNWWLANHDLDEDYDAGDNVPAWRKFVMDTDPKVAGDYLRITSVSNAPAGGTEVVATPASAWRYYTLRRRADLTTGEWEDVPDQVNLAGTGGVLPMQDADPADKMFYSVEVKVSP